MYFKELIYQGVFGATQGARLELNNGLNEPRLDAPLTAEDLQTLVAYTLYPADARSSGLLRLDGAGPFRIGAVFELAGREYKLVQDFTADTIQLLGGTGGTKVLANKAEKVQAVFKKHLDLLPWSAFLAIHLHRFGGSSSSERDPELAQLIDEYRRALSIEAVERSISDVEAELAEYENVKSPAVKIELALDRIKHALVGMKDLPVLSQHERRFLEEFDERRNERDAEVEELLKSKDTNARRLTEMRPTPLLRDPILWSGIALGILFIVAAIWLQTNVSKSLRLVALGDALGFGLAAYAGFRWVGSRERFSGVEGYAKHLEKRQSEIEKEGKREETRSAKLLEKYNAPSAQQIVEDIEKKASLEKKKAALEEKLLKFQNDPDFIRRRNELRVIRERLASLRTRRASFGDFALPTYELSGELKVRGIDVEGLRPADERPEDIMLEAARALTFIPKDQDVPSSKMINLKRMLPPIVGQQDADLCIVNGELRVTLEGRSEVALGDLSGKEQLMVLRSVALAVLIGHHKTRTKDGAETPALVVLDNPWQGLSKSERVRLYGVFKELGKTFQVVLPKPG